jgi:hypothetical protein
MARADLLPLVFSVPEIYSVTFTDLRNSARKTLSPFRSRIGGPLNGEATCRESSFELAHLF